MVLKEVTGASTPALEPSWCFLFQTK